VQSRVAARVAADAADQHYQRRQLAGCWSAWSGLLAARMRQPGGYKQPSQVRVPRAGRRAAAAAASSRARAGSHGAVKGWVADATAMAAAGSGAQRSRRAGPLGSHSTVWGALLKNSRRGPHQAQAAAAQGWKQLQQEHAQLDIHLLLDVTNVNAMGSHTGHTGDQCATERKPGSTGVTMAAAGRGGRGRIAGDGCGRQGAEARLTGSRRRRGTSGAGCTPAGAGAYGRAGQPASWLALLQRSHAPAAGPQGVEGRDVHRVPADVAHTACH
jgi:hypothetical protein